MKGRTKRKMGLWINCNENKAYDHKVANIIADGKDYKVIDSFWLHRT